MTVSISKCRVCVVWSELKVSDNIEGAQILGYLRATANIYFGLDFVFYYQQDQ